MPAVITGKNQLSHPDGPEKQISDKAVTCTHIHLHTTQLWLVWLGNHQGIPSASTNSLHELRMARYQVIITMTITTCSKTSGENNI